MTNPQKNCNNNHQKECRTQKLCLRETDAVKKGISFSRDSYSISFLRVYQTTRKQLAVVPGKQAYREKTVL